MRTLLKTLAVVGMIICVSGCVNRQVTVIDSAIDVVRLGKGVRGPIYTQNANGEWQLQGPVTLPEGWYAGPGPSQ
jgi:hypothetical protein